LIKTLQIETATSGNHFDQINWDGRDEYGDPIGKGVYIYKVRVKSEQGQSAEEFQKLVILN
jgi:flagellar hook assembly protein FlgD